MAQSYATRVEVCGVLGTPGGVAPEFNETPDDVISVWLDVAAQFIGLQRWGARASIGHALLTAHFLTAIAGTAGTGAGALELGPITSAANGPASYAFGTASPAVTDPELGTTKYGRAYVALRRVITGRGCAVIGNSRVRQRQ